MKPRYTDAFWGKHPFDGDSIFIKNKNNKNKNNIGVVHTVYTYTTYARECVCNYSGFSERIPRRESPLCYQRSQGVVDRVRVQIIPHTDLRESGALVQGHI